MSKVAKVIGTVASVVAFAAGVALLFVPGTQLVGIGMLTLSQLAAGASAIAAVAMAVSQATAKPPDAKGSVSQVMIGKNMAVPYAMGRTYCGGFQVYDKSAGEKNRERSQIMVLSAAGPVESLDALLADYSNIGIGGSGGGLIGPGVASGYYNNFLWASSRKGLRPETAFTAPAGLSALNQWDATYKLSGYAAYCVTMKFDKDGERFASGVPQWGVIFKGTKVYDPRLDSTYPGGSGACRWNDEATFVYGVSADPSGENPALHALTYARGRYIEKDAGGTPLANPVKIVGCGFEWEQIEVAQFVELANLCDANNWRVGGLVYEGPGVSKWDNLKHILAACAAEPVWSGGKLGVKICAPRVPVVTIGYPDLTDGELSVQAMKTFREKVNTVVPRVRLETQKWEYTQLDEVSSSTYLTEDGETKSKEVQYDLVQNKDQGAQLAAYTLVNGREFGPIALPLKPGFMIYKVGEAVTLNLPELGLNSQLAIITARQVDPSTGGVSFTLESETTAKHSFALGQVGVAPPSPTLVPPDVLDQAAGSLDLGASDAAQLILNSSAKSLTLSINSVGKVTISNHTRVYADKEVAVTGGSVTPAPAGVNPDAIGVFYDDPDRLGGAVVYQYLRIVGGAGPVDSLYPSATNPSRHFVALMTVPTSGSTSGGSGIGPGTGGSSGPGGAYKPVFGSEV